MIGDIIKDKTPISTYQPPQEVIDFTRNVKRDYSDGVQILNRPWTELNEYSVIDRMNKDQRTFNSFVDESSEDPHEAWKWRGTRSLARNKAMAMHAHLTSNYIVPLVFAQNEKQQEDRDTAGVMRDILEWMTINSNYRSSFLLATMGMLVNPVTYLEGEYCEVYQKVKDSETKSIKEVLDETLSGFQANVMSADQILITNAFEQNIQRQRSLIKRRYVDYNELEAKYGKHENWVYVQPGIKTVLGEENGLFYDIKDDEHASLVEETTWLSRREDSEVCFINGIYFGDSDVEWNPIRHRDNRNAPKYNISPFGYERINEHFFFYKSLMNRVGWDDQLIDAMYEMVMNREFLDLMPPVSISGDDQVDTQVIFPGATFASQNPDFKMTPVLHPSSGNGYRALKETEGSMSESSLSDTQMGSLPEASQKAYTVAKAEQNSKILLSGVGKTMGQSVTQFGQLMIDIALQHITTAQVDEITGDMNYRAFVLSDQMVGGKKVSKRILFDEFMMGHNMSEEKRKEKTMKMLSEVGYPDNKEHLYRINPHLFSKTKYLARVEADVMSPKNEVFQQILSERLYTLLREDPLIEPEALVRDLLNSYRKDTEKLITSQSKQIMGGLEQPQNKKPQLPGLPMGIEAGAMA